MKHKAYTLLLICVATLFPSITTAQSFFAQQNVAVWEIFDRNNDVKLASSTKTTIRVNIEKAFTDSQHYKFYQFSIPEVKAELEKRQLPRSPFNIANVLREISIAKGSENIVDYVIFTVVKVKQHSNSYNSFVVNLSSELLSTETLKCERMADVDMLSDPNAIPHACSQLVSELLGEQLSSNTQRGSVAQPSYQQQASHQLYSTESAEDLYKKGVQLDKEKLYTEAIQYFRSAAEKGLAIAQNKLGLYYMRGKGVERNYLECVKWYRMAAEQGYKNAQYTLGYCYYYGIGVEKDYLQAIQWFNKAAEQGHRTAQYRLGVCFENGIGVKRNIFMATQWYQKAAEQGHKGAKEKLNNL